MHRIQQILGHLQPLGQVQARQEVRNLLYLTWPPSEEPAMLQMQLQSSSSDAYRLQVPGITRNDTLTGRKVNVAVLGECQCLQ